MNKLLPALLVLSNIFLPHVLTAHHDSLVQTRSITLVGNTGVTVRGLFMWRESDLAVLIEGGALSKPFSFRLDNDEYSIGDALITPQAAHTVLGKAVWSLYEWGCHENRQTLIFKYLIDNDIIPNYVFLDSNGKYRVVAKAIIKIMDDGLKIKFIDPSSQEKLGTATINNDSHEIIWVPNKNQFAKTQNNKANKKSCNQQCCLRLRRYFSSLFGYKASKMW
jgi:hypothetical protein